jgi:hypothetical protein
MARSRTLPFALHRDNHRAEPPSIVEMLARTEDK